MDSPFAISGTHQLTSASPYILLQSKSEGSVSFGPSNKPSSSWRKFISSSLQRTGCESVVTVIPVERTTTEGPTVLRSASVPELTDVQEESFFRFLDDLESGAYAANDITAEE